MFGVKIALSLPVSKASFTSDKQALFMGSIAAGADCAVHVHICLPLSPARALLSSTRALHDFGLGLSAVCEHVLLGHPELQLNNQNRRQDILYYTYICIYMYKCTHVYIHDT